MNIYKTCRLFLIAILMVVFLTPPQIYSQSAQTAPAPTKQEKPETPKEITNATGEWPREIQNPKGKLVIYQPQIDEWQDYKLVKARSAIAFAPKGTDNPKLGIIEMQARTDVDFESRLVKLTRLEITGGNFPGLDQAQKDKALADLRALLNKDQLRSISLDRMLVSLERSGVRNVEVKTDPPKILYSSKPAVLVIFDGKPILSPIKDSDLKFVVNTNWDAFYLEKTKMAYLRNDKSWMQAPVLEGPYIPVENLPDEFKKLPNDENWKEVKDNVPGKNTKAEEAPVVFVSEEPAEMIVTTGQPSYQPIPQTNLVWVNNTESDLIFSPSDGYYYYLVSGRWFKTKSLENGPWVFATPNLPEDFKKIPAEHAIGNLKASIPGTKEAEEAVIQASIPQTAKVSKKEIKAPQVTYAGGKPDFQPIEKTTLLRAVNTPDDVIQVKDEYYLCYEGIWFVSKSPTGPWAVAEKIPAEIYTIPPSSPSYNTTYVTV